MSHILLVSATLNAGGAERQLTGMANYWVGSGHRVTLTTWSGPEVADFYPLDPRVERVRFAIPLARGSLQVPWILARRVRSLRRLLHLQRPDAVVSFIAATNIHTLLASTGLRLTVAVSDRAHPAVDATVTRPWRVLRRLLYRFADRVVAQTTQAREWTRRYCDTDSLVIPNALRPLVRVDAPRETLVLAIGRLDPQKGFDILLRAFALLAGRFREWNVAILGEGPEREGLLALRASLGLESRVVLVGEVRDVESWLARAGLVVQPSRYEGFPNAVLEAMGFGAAVVSTDCLAGPSDLIRDGVNGRLVRVDDTTGLAQVMAELMGKPELRARLGEQAAAVRETYRLESVMMRWNEALGLAK
ncbi:MAG TPA: glycosyltransferase family 4 protein [Steroidobacteraceae bacterium]|nr:glycosyltransferase family 4 protein [Steroidobacteraceae bacterium]